LISIVVPDKNGDFINVVYEFNTTAQRENLRVLNALEVVFPEFKGCYVMWRTS
jgi:hypothetical protein